MAIQTRSDVAIPTVCTASEYEGTARLVLGPKGQHPANKSNLFNATARKLRDLFTLDEQGDSNIFNVLQFVLEDSDVFETRGVVEAMDQLMHSYLDVRAQLYEKAGLTE